MCLVLGVIGDHEIGIATQRALEDLLPLRLIEAADELPGAVSARRPLVIVASHRDRFDDPVVPHLAEVRDVLPQIGIVLISDIGATLSNGIRDLSMLGEIRSVRRGHATIPRICDARSMSRPSATAPSTSCARSLRTPRRSFSRYSISARASGASGCAGARSRKN